MIEKQTDNISLAMGNVGKLAFGFVESIWKSIRECFYGYMNGVMPFQGLTILSVCASLFWSFKWDVVLLKLIHASFPKFDIGPPVGILRLICWGLSISFPFIYWGWQRKNTIDAILKYLQDAFESAGLRNNDKYPSLIRDYVTDNGSRVLQLLSDGVVLSQYIEKQEILENKLGVEIEAIRQHKQYAKIIEIEFSSGPLDIVFNLPATTGYGDFTFPIGKTRTETIIGDLTKIPHYLFAGMTGKGKSSFIKTMVTVLLTNNKNLKVLFIDLKGSEASIFDEHPRVASATSEKVALSRIEEADKIITDRKEIFRVAKVNDLETYNRIAPSGKALNRILVVVDEIAQLTPSLAVDSHEEIRKAGLLLNKISRMGRSFGVHLIVGVQKPDSRNLDSTIKANLEGILCFQVANQTQSRVVLDNNKATDLSGIAGRAVWQTSEGEKIVQTAYLSQEKISAYVKGEKENGRELKSGLAPEDAGRQRSSSEDCETHADETEVNKF